MPPTTEPQRIQLTLPPQAERYARSDAPREVRLMAARGALPLPPVDLATVLFALMHDPDAEVKGLARDSLEGLPDGFCQAVLSGDLNMDGAISFCGSQALQALRESCRVCRRKLIITVSHRAQMSAVLVSSSIKVLEHVGASAEHMLKQGEWHQEQFAENTIPSTGMTQNYMGSLRAFLPGELRQFLNEHGMKILRCGGLGSLANFCGGETIEAISKDEPQFQKLLDYCEYFDLEVLPDGPGTRQRAGLIAVAEVLETATLAVNPNLLGL